MNRYGEFYGYDGVSLKTDGEFVLYEDAQNKISELEKERDQLKAALKLADALRNHERGM